MEYTNTQSSVEASTSTIIDTSLHRIVAALFKQQADAAQARSSLERYGFSTANIYVFALDDVDRVVTVLTELDIPQDVASYYQVDVRAGMTLLVVVANEQSQDVLNFLRGNYNDNEMMDQANTRVLQNIEKDTTNVPTPTDVKSDITGVKDTLSGSRSVTY